MTHAILCVLAVALCVWESISLWHWYARCRRIEQRLARDLETIEREYRAELGKRPH